MTSDDPLAPPRLPAGSPTSGGVSGAPTVTGDHRRAGEVADAHPASPATDLVRQAYEVLWHALTDECPTCHGEGFITVGGFSLNPSTGVYVSDPQEAEDWPCPDCR